MNRQEHILSCLAEECCEVGQRVSKALRFGLGEIQPGQELTNAERIRVEFVDLLTVMMMLVETGAIERVNEADLPAMEEKRQKIEKFLDYAKSQGALSD